MRRRTGPHVCRFRPTAAAASYAVGGYGSVAGSGRTHSEGLNHRRPGPRDLKSHSPGRGWTGFGASTDVDSDQDWLTVPFHHFSDMPQKVFARLEPLVVIVQVIELSMTLNLLDPAARLRGQDFGFQLL